jgi:hypothetical protein
LPQHAPPREVDEVNEQEVRELFFERLEHLSAEAEYELRHPDYVMEMPQSGERIRGSDYDGQIYHVAMVVEFRDGKIWRDTRYYAEPFEAPAWRAQWVEPIEAPG